MNPPHRPRPKRGRPRNATRDAAILAGYLYFQGKPCKHGHAGKRYASTGACVDCYAVKPVVDLASASDEFSSLFD